MRPKHKRPPGQVSSLGQNSALFEIGPRCGKKYFLFQGTACCLKQTWQIMAKVPCLPTGFGSRTEWRRLPLACQEGQRTHLCLLADFVSK